MITLADFEKSKLAPRDDELQWMYKQLCDKSIDSVLEFGCGVTTWVIHEATNPKSYTAIEEYTPCIIEVEKHIDNVDIINNWSDIPDVVFDLIFVDSSAGCGKKGLHRTEAVQRVEEQLRIGGYMMIHDSRGRSGRGPRQYLEKSEHFKLFANFPGRTGVQIYQRT